MGEWRLAPIHISFMLACYFSSDPEQELGSDHWNSPAGKKVRDWLVRNELIEPKTHKATGRGEAWVDFICEMPLPEQSWVRPPEKEKP